MVHDDVNLTRIRLHLAIYFCLHRGTFAGKHGKLTSFDGQSTEEKFAAPKLSFSNDFARPRTRRAAENG
jgi:hypothetical protein